MTNKISKHVCVCNEEKEAILKLSSQLNNIGTKKDNPFLLKQKIEKMDLLAEEIINDERLKKYCCCLAELNERAAEKFEKR